MNQPIDRTRHDDRLRSGTVSLVGAGPGDPELLTLRAARRLSEADVVLFDHLVSPEILSLCSIEARLVDVGKIPGGRSTGQDVIERLLLKEAKTGARVVRLKGGDPFVFGRGGEEAIFLRAHGVEVEIVPGISSCVAAPAAAGIPVTHRGVSTQFTVVTGHSARQGEELVERWRHLAAAGGTLVFLMGVRALPDIVATLREAGVPDERPAAVVASATTDAQTVVEATLATIVDEAAAADVRSPAVIVVGDVVALRAAIASPAPPPSLAALASVAL